MLPRTEIRARETADLPHRITRQREDFASRSVWHISALQSVKTTRYPRHEPPWNPRPPIAYPARHWSEPHGHTCKGIEISADARTWEICYFNRGVRERCEDWRTIFYARCEDKKLEKSRVGSRDGDKVVYDRENGTMFSNHSEGKEMFSKLPPRERSEVRTQNRAVTSTAAGCKNSGRLLQVKYTSFRYSDLTPSFQLARFRRQPKPTACILFIVPRASNNDEVTIPDITHTYKIIPTLPIRSIQKPNPSTSKAIFQIYPWLRVEEATREGPDVGNAWYFI